MESHFPNMDHTHSRLARERVMADLKALAGDAEALIRATADDASDKAKEELLRSILDPSARVLPEYISYTISTKNFEDYAGLMVKQDAGSVTLRAAGGLEQSVQRSDIETMTPGALSLMPEGLEAALDKQAMADLIEFIQRPDMDALKKAVAEAAPKP